VVAVEHELLSPAGDRRWRRILDPRARRAPAVAPHPRLAAHGTPWWWRLRRTSVRWHDTPGDGAARTVEMAAPGGAAGRRVRWRAPGTPRDVACSSAHLAATDGVQPSGGGGSSSAAGLSGGVPSSQAVRLLSFCSGGAASLTSPSAPSPVTP